MLTKYKTRVAATYTAFLIIISGCEKFLDVEPQGQLTEEEIAGNLDAARQLVNGVYNSLYFGGFDKTTVGFQYSVATEVSSDNADKGSFDADYTPARDIDNFTFTPTNPIFNNLWTGYYSGIVRANQALNSLEASTFDQTTKNQFIGEVRFIRGMYYFNLVRLFGGVPKIIRVPNATEANSDEFQTRASREEIYQVIIDDLQFAADNLPLKGDPNTLPGRATKGAAQALLAKVYLYQKNWQKAFDLSREVILSGKYSLVQDYASLFRLNAANNSESIFEVQTGTTPNCDAVSPLFSNSQGPRAGGPARGGWNDVGFGFVNPTTDLLAAYESNDKRRDATIIFIQPTVAGGPNPGTILWDGVRIPTKDSVENERYNYKAYYPVPSTGPCAGNKDRKPKNITIIRYAEVLLIYAEAAAMLGNSGEALDKLKMVRERAGLTNTTSASQQDIWEERRVELAMEQDRFFDLVRQGRAAQVLGNKGFVANKHEVFPIPQAQIDLSGNRLEQNPNY